MSNGNDGGENSIDRAVKSVIERATSDAVDKSVGKLETSLSSATKGADAAAKRLETATKGADKAVDSGERAIRKLNQLVLAVASMPVLQAIAELVPSNPDGVVEAIARIAGAVIPLLGLVCVRWSQGRNSRNPKEDEAQAREGP